MHYEIGANVGYKYWAEITDCVLKKENTVMYRAKLSGTEVPLLIKSVSNRKQKCLQKEYEILSCLRHSGIPRVLEFVENAESSFMIMLYYEGETLENVLQRVGKFSEQTVLCIAKQLCEILCYLQTRKEVVLHNDIKPSNILLQEDGNIILLDFGLACLEGEKVGNVLFQGTLGYAAPECWHRDVVLTKSADTFAFGSTIYRLLEAKQPKEHYGNLILTNEDKRKRWQFFLDKCCNLEAKCRYQNAAQIYEALLQISFS